MGMESYTVEIDASVTPSPGQLRAALDCEIWPSYGKAETFGDSFWFYVDAGGFLVNIRFEGVNPVLVEFALMQRISPKRVAELVRALAELLGQSEIWLSSRIDGQQGAWNVGDVGLEEALAASIAFHKARWHRYDQRPDRMGTINDAYL